MLQRLDPTDLALLRRVNRGFRAAVESSSDLPRAGVSEEVPFEVYPFVTSVKLLAWAEANGCQWVAGICTCAAQLGNLEVVKWARAHDCPWDEMTCWFAARDGHLDMLRWAREHGCPCTAATVWTTLSDTVTLRCCSGRKSTVARQNGRQNGRRRTRQR